MKVLAAGGRYRTGAVTAARLHAPACEVSGR